MVITKKIVYEIDRIPKCCEECAAYSSKVSLLDHEIRYIPDCDFGYMDGGFMQGFDAGKAYEGCRLRMDERIRLAGAQVVDKQVYDDLYAKYCKLAELHSVELSKLIEAIREFKAADSEPIRHGIWMCAESGPDIVCSACKTEFNDEIQFIKWTSEMPKRCPECGAHMTRGW